MFAVGSLVKARNREWVVLPDSDKDLLVLRPLGGTEDEVTGIYLPLEKVESAQFELPSSEKIGDYRSCKLLRDSVRLGFRSSAGPFRSFAQIAVEPRPYQLVPLLMALKLDPVRILIADDVGIGKTVESGLIARELLDRGEVKGLAVLCPPHLAEQWQTELKNKFHIDAELVLASTVRKLEKNCAVGQSLFDIHPNVIVSMDFIKSDRRRDEFLRSCPKLVIVDEAHTCAYGEGGKGGRHQRHQLLKGLSSDPQRHLILVTATPHSGKEQAFRSLLSLLKPEFIDLPEDLTGKENEHYRRLLGSYIVQRRRADIKHYLKSDTPFPDRKEKELTYNLSLEYKKFFEKVLNYTREIVSDPSGSTHRHRVRWWSALALLRALASSPASAIATLKTRASTVDTETPEDADEIGRRTIFDVEDNDNSERADIIPGCLIDEDDSENSKERRRLLDMVKDAQNFLGAKDEKLKKAISEIKSLVKEGYHPIVFCRFITTAEYVAEELRKALPKVEIGCVTGTLPPAEREERVLQLVESSSRILVCTDCLSEGINLQEGFNAIFHYDLSWNPTRHEQREGRVDRYGQPSDEIRIVNYYGVDNYIDKIIIDVLIKKHRQIRSSLGVSVPIPIDNDVLVEAIFEGILLSKKANTDFEQLALFEDFIKPKKEQLSIEWDDAAEKERRSRTIFAQDPIQRSIDDQVVKEIEAIREAIGSGFDVRDFVETSLKAHNAFVKFENNIMEVDLKESDLALKESIGNIEKFKAKFELPITDKVIYLNRTHPIVEGIASYIMTSALDTLSDSLAKRSGVIRTSKVERRTTLLLLRFRYHIITQKDKEEIPLLAEDCQLVGFRGSPENAEWITKEEAELLIDSKPEENITQEEASNFINRVISGFDSISEYINNIASLRGEDLLDAHKRVRQAMQNKGIKYRIETKLPPDVLGVYVYLPR